MSERQIHLDIQTSNSQLASGTLSQPGPQERQIPDADTLGRFARAMSTEPLTQQSMLTPPTQLEPAPLSGPLGLFKHGNNTERSEQLPGHLIEQLTHGVRQMLVSKEQRSMQLHLEEVLMPGVKVKVFEDAGAWVAEFSCTEPNSYKKLAAASTPMASQLALALTRDAVWRVLMFSTQTEPLDMTEAFASAPGSH
jgi:hypothetical protein